MSNGNERHKELSIEPFFLGPKSENEYWAREQFQSILDHWFQWRRIQFENDPPAIDNALQNTEEYKKLRKKMAKELLRLNELLKSEVPKYTPRYIGHMVSEISLPAFLGHFSTLLHNPNNTSHAVARVGSQLEKEGIEMLLELIGFEPKKACGHFTSGGTIANFEAIWRARFRLDHWLSLALYLKSKNLLEKDFFSSAHMGWQSFNTSFKKHNISDENLRAFSFNASNPWRTSLLIHKHFEAQFEGPIMLVPGNKHFSWQKGCNIFGLGEEALWSIPLDQRGLICPEGLKELIEKAYKENRPILMVVSVAGTTETGEIDPVHKVQEVLDEYKKTKGWDIWHHVDAAYGGFMCSLLFQPEIKVLSQEQKLALKSISKAHSVTLDPHKLGYIPYSCGAFLSQDPDSYAVAHFQAPYLERTDFSMNRWSSTIEGSRTAAGASATWLTGKTMGFQSKVFAKLIADTFEACESFIKELKPRVHWFYPLKNSETNILCFSVAEKGEKLSQVNQRTAFIFEKFVESPHFSVSKTTLHKKNYKALIENHVKSFQGEFDVDECLLIRCVFMNPFWSSKKLGEKLREEFYNEIEVYFNQWKGDKQ